MNKEQEKFQETFKRITENSSKFLNNFTDQHLNDFNYIPESIQPYANDFLRKGRLKFDLLSELLEGTEKSSDEYVSTKKEIEKIAKSFVNLRNQVDSYKSGMAEFKTILGDLNKGTQDSNYFINSSIFGNQWSDMIIDDEGNMNFTIGKGKDAKLFPLNSLLDFRSGSAPMITEPWTSKNLVMKLAQKTKSEKDLGRPFDYEWAYNSVLNNLTDMGPSETIGMAYTDLAGDGRTKSFAEMYVNGLKNENYYKHPETGVSMPKDSLWMKDPANAGVLNLFLSRYIADVMKDVYGTVDKKTGQVTKKAKSQSQLAQDLIKKYKK